MSDQSEIYIILINLGNSPEQGEFGRFMTMITSQLVNRRTLWEIALTRTVRMVSKQTTDKALRSAYPRTFRVLRKVDVADKALRSA